jgi:hypothetical protein
LAEIRGVKSALIIAALGVGGCVLLSMVMQKAVAIDTERRQLPFVPALAARFGPQLAGPLRVREEPLAGGLELAVSACVRGAELWLLGLRAGSRAQAARVVLRGEDGAQLVSMPVRRPGPDRSPAPPR